MVRFINCCNISYDSTNLYDAVNGKVSDAGKSGREVIELADELERQGYFLEDIASMPSLRKSQYE